MAEVYTSIPGCRKVRRAVTGGTDPYLAGEAHALKSFPPGEFLMYAIKP